MYSSVLAALAATAFTWLATAAGAAVVLLLPRRSKGLPDALLGFAAGVMISASFWSLLQPAVHWAREGGLSPAPMITLGFLAGAVLMWLADKAAAAALPSEPPQGLLLMMAITLHNIPEGLAVGVAFGAAKPGDPGAMLAAAAVALGVGLQNIPEGAAVALPMHQQGVSKGRSFFLGQASALVEPLAGIAGALLVSQVRALLPWALSFAAGAMLLVSVHELIPRCRSSREGSYASSFWIIGGFSLMMLLDVLLS